MRFRYNLKIATIRGVDLKLHISMIFILAYIILVASVQFPIVVRQIGLTQAAVGLNPILWGVIFAVGLFASVVLHEYGHVFMAQAQGGKVTGVTLWMLGGASEIESMPEKPYGELKLSIVGPLVSFALAGILYLVAGAVTSPGVILISRWLGTVNLVLAVFNMLPAFPLDGGRVLRSFLVERHGKMRGTEKAVSISKGFSILLGFLGILGLNILLVLIAVFIYMAAQSEFVFLKNQESLSGVSAGELVLKTSVLSGDETIDQALDEMQRTRMAVLPLAGGSSLATLDHLRRVPPSMWSRQTVSQVAEPVTRHLDMDERVDQAFRDLISAPSQTLPVMEQGRVIGVIRLSDISDFAQFKTLKERHEGRPDESPEARKEERKEERHPPSKAA